MTQSRSGCLVKSYSLKLVFKQLLKKKLGVLKKRWGGGKGTSGQEAGESNRKSLEINTGHIIKKNLVTPSPEDHQKDSLATSVALESPATVEDKYLPRL